MKDNKERMKPRYRLFKNVHGTPAQVTACPDLNALVRAAFRMGALYRMTPVEISAQEEKKGKWLRTDAYPHHVYCSECYKTFITNDEWNIWADGDLPRNYCPNCGSRMEVQPDE